MTKWKSANNIPTNTENKATTGLVAVERKFADIIFADTKDRTPPSPVAKKSYKKNTSRQRKKYTIAAK
jgi:hypothetical protein